MWHSEWVQYNSSIITYDKKSQDHYFWSVYWRTYPYILLSHPQLRRLFWNRYIIFSRFIQNKYPQERISMSDVKQEEHWWRLAEFVYSWRYMAGEEGRQESFSLLPLLTSNTCNSPPWGVTAGAKEKLHIYPDLWLISELAHICRSVKAWAS